MLPAKLMMTNSDVTACGSVSSKKPGAMPAVTCGKPVDADATAPAGVFTLTSIPQDMLEPVLLVEAPRLLFPFARSIVSDVTRESGFPAVLLQPIDFLALWQSRRNQNAASDLAPPAANA